MAALKLIALALLLAFFFIGSGEARAGAGPQGTRRPHAARPSRVALLAPYQGWQSGQGSQNAFPLLPGRRTVPPTLAIGKPGRKLERKHTTTAQAESKLEPTLPISLNAEIILIQKIK